MIKNSQLTAQLDETHTAQNGLALAQVIQRTVGEVEFNVRILTFLIACF